MGLFKRSKHPHLSLNLPVRPVSKGRPRFSRWGKARTPKRTKDFAEDLRKAVVRSLKRDPDEFPVYPKGYPLRVDVDFIFPRPKDKSGPKFPDGLIWRPVGEDGDNLEKAVYDALNEIVWADDSQIVDVRWRKMYGPKPGVPLDGLLGDGGGRVCLRVRPLETLPNQRLCLSGLDDERSTEDGFEWPEEHEFPHLYDTASK